MRAAIYFTPPADAPLTHLAAAWLGRDAFASSSVPLRAPEPWLAPLVAEPARYGFHATMKAPFRLADGMSAEALDAALAAFCAERAAPTIRSLALRRISGFFALVPDQAEPELDALAAQTVRRFEPFRAGLSPAEFARRKPESLSERQRAHLAEWGYPYVFEAFRFHMTLTGRVPDEAAPAVEAVLLARFEPVLGRPLPVDGLALFCEDAPGAPFTVQSRHPLRIEP
ncbi:DUF1045 domain-containing protein [Aureimonas ureilytica]|uniref:DUF1045 domain-containing protein n=1 Tax=Aureimonas ureilytica TaxID=401562 RepID=UPI00035DE77B|nr:DUF1045 domain-containing protein [Aureimonas ureilytica]